MADGETADAFTLAHLAAPPLYAWGSASRSASPIFSTNRSQEAAHLRALCDASVHIGLGAVHPASARSPVRKLLALEPDSRASSIKWRSTLAQRRPRHRRAQSSFRASSRSRSRW